MRLPVFTSDIIQEHQVINFEINSLDKNFTINEFALLVHNNDPEYSVYFLKKRNKNEEWIKEAFTDHRMELLRQFVPDIDFWDASFKQQALSQVPVVVPSKVNVPSNMREAWKWVSIGQLIAKVSNKSDWDFKQKGYFLQDFGNWHFGVITKVMGLPRPIPEIGAGVAQMLAGTSSEITFNLTALLKPPYGDDPRDNTWINQGYFFTERLREIAGRARYYMRMQMNQTPSSYGTEVSITPQTTGDSGDSFEDPTTHSQNGTNPGRAEPANHD